MKILLLLLFVGTANLIMCSEGKDEVKFPPMLLQPDLEAIEHYFVKTNNDMAAFVRWPKNIGFVVNRVVKHGDHLKIQGTFKVPIRDDPEWVTYDGLYFKQGKFYVMKEFLLELIPNDAPVYYSQPTLPTPEQYLSIKYFGLEEIKKMIEPLHSIYVTDPTSPRAAYLAIASKPEHFIEYSLWSKVWPDRVVDGHLRVLIGTEEKPKQVTLSQSVEAVSLVYNESNHDVFITTESNRFDPEGAKPLQNVFGVRMAKFGVLAEVTNSKVKLFNSDDLKSSKPIKHAISVIDFLRKVENLDPQYKIHDRVRPPRTNFQVMGHVLVKRYNIPNGVHIDKDCPLVIEYVMNGSHFLIGADKVEKLCTDDSRLWAKNDGKNVYTPRDVIILI